MAARTRAPRTAFRVLSSKYKFAAPILPRNCRWNVVRSNKLERYADRLSMAPTASSPDTEAGS